MQRPVYLRWMFVIIILMVLIGQSGCMTTPETLDTSQATANEVRSHITPGMKREDALAILKKSAWQHTVCDYSDHSRYDRNYYIDIFLYGSHDTKSAGVILIMSYPSDGVYKVTFVGTEENSRLSLYDSCLVESPQS
jgi:hypothetical protein